MEMLAAFIRERSRQHWPPPDPGGQAWQRSAQPDVQAEMLSHSAMSLVNGAEPINSGQK